MFLCFADHFLFPVDAVMLLSKYSKLLNISKGEYTANKKAGYDVNWMFNMFPVTVYDCAKANPQLRQQ